MSADELAALLGALSHELRSPITALQMLLELAEPGPDGGLTLDAELSAMLRRTADELTAFAARVEALAADRG